jgi:hypothetical protein
MSLAALPVCLLLSFGGLGFPELLIILVFFFGFGVCGTGFWIWMLVDCATKEADHGNNKVTWILVIALAHFIGAAIYFFARRPQRIAELGR